MIKKILILVIAFSSPAYSKAVSASISSKTPSNTQSKNEAVARLVASQYYYLLADMDSAQILKYVFHFSSADQKEFEKDLSTVGTRKPPTLSLDKTKIIFLEDGKKTILDFKSVIDQALFLNGYKINTGNGLSYLRAKTIIADIFKLKSRVSYFQLLVSEARAVDPLTIVFMIVGSISSDEKLVEEFKESSAMYKLASFYKWRARGHLNLLSADSPDRPRSFDMFTCEGSKLKEIFTANIFKGRTVVPAEERVREKTLSYTEQGTVLEKTYGEAKCTIKVGADQLIKAESFEEGAPSDCQLMNLGKNISDAAGFLDSGLTASATACCKETDCYSKYLNLLNQIANKVSVEKVGADDRFFWNRAEQSARKNEKPTPAAAPAPAAK